MTIQQTTLDSTNANFSSTKSILFHFFRAIAKSTRNQSNQAVTSFWVYTETNGNTDTTSFNGLI
jgi:hypothetical protein